MSQDGYEGPFSKRYIIQPGYLSWCLSFAEAGLIFLALKAQYSALNLVSRCLWLRTFVLDGGEPLISLTRRLRFSPRLCWTARWCRAKRPALFWRVWGRGPATWSRSGLAPWPGTELTARICSSKHSRMVSGWVACFSAWVGGETRAREPWWKFWRVRECKSDCETN